MFIEHHTVEKCHQESRIKQMESDGKETLVQLAILGNDVSYIKTAVDKIEHLIVDKYVTKDEFQPIKRIVYGVTGLILTSVIVALIALVVHSG
jgi:ABC-type phosphate transport system permease subunit